MSVGPVLRDAATADFFDAAARGVFLLRHCPNGHCSEPAAAQCTDCGSTALSWRPASGLATLVSWAVAVGRHDGDSPPYRSTLVIGELAEGPWWWSQLAGAKDARLRVGMPLRIAFERPDEQHEPVPVFLLR